MVWLYDDQQDRYVGETTTDFDGFYRFDNVDLLDRYAVFCKHHEDVPGYEEGYDWTVFEDGLDSKVFKTHPTGFGETDRFKVISGDTISNMHAEVINEEADVHVSFTFAQTKLDKSPSMMLVQLSGRLFQSCHEMDALNDCLRRQSHLECLSLFKIKNS